MHSATWAYHSDMILQEADIRSQWFGH